MSDHPADLGVSEAAEALRAGRLTSEELTAACFERITARDPLYSAWLNVYEEDALAAARAADARLRDGDDRPLLGIPIGLKDVVGVAGRPLTADSAVLRGNVAEVDSTVWGRLAECGTGLPRPRDWRGVGWGAWGGKPRGRGFRPGGLGSGRGLALAGRTVPGTDRSRRPGSIRIPAAFLNLTAVKPSFG